MSYILDALKKAEQEREQGAVPGLHAQQVMAADASASTTGLSPLVWAGIGVALTLAGVLTWHNWPQPPTPPASVAEPVTVRPADAPQVGAQAPAPAADRHTPAAPLARTEPPPAHGDVAMQVDGAPLGAGRPWPAQPALSVPARAGGTPNAARPPAPETAGQPPLPRLADLPETVRKDLPALAVGGAMHSATPSQRMLVLNGQVLHEGDSPLAGLQLEEIRLKSAVLNFRGQRFELPF